MCWIIDKEKEKEFNFKYIEQAQTKNQDGYGVTWFDGEKLQTFRTLDFQEMMDFLKTGELNKFRAILHLRNTTAGCDSIENTHPFDVPTGVMFHNGTISALKPSYTTVPSEDTKKSDTARLAEIISSCKFEKLEDIEPLLQVVIGDTLNRLVFFNNDGTVNIMNKHLGIEEPENGLWMSNEYHIPVPKTPVFVYGTLKKGFSNYDAYLSDVEFVGAATTKVKWAMVGKDAYFPYLLCPHVKGFFVKGEVYLADEWDMYYLDYLEGVASRHYKKVKLPVTLDESGEEKMVTAYVKHTVTADTLQQEFIEEFTSKKQLYLDNVY